MFELERVDRGEKRLKPGAVRLDPGAAPDPHARRRPGPARRPGRQGRRHRYPADGEVFDRILAVPLERQVDVALSDRDATELALDVAAKVLKGGETP